MKKLFLFLFIAFLSGCGTTLEQNNQMDLRVNSYTVSCVGEMEGNCLLVQEGDKIGSDDWEYFYYEDDIVGFDYEPGFIYDLVVVKKNIENPPADASSFTYELVRIVSKKEQ